MALPLMTANERAEVEQLINELQYESRDLTEFKKRAAEAFERDMQPVRTALVQALQEGDLAALRGLRMLLPSILADVNEQPALADLLAYQLGKEVLEGMRMEGGAQ